MDKRMILEQRSKLRLKKDVKKKIETTMIGSLASIEKFFGSFWGTTRMSKLQNKLRLKRFMKSLGLRFWTKAMCR